ncbi:MAG TPA: LD-carboxypeptidase [Cyclobacteriaceae bacterium]|jgi:muramoyltetrapeptide carboxypeptidase
MIAPRNLKRGDRVALVAPAGKITRDVLTRAVRVLEEWDLKVTVGDNVMSKSHSYLSGSDEERLVDLQEALDSRRVKAIFCARGGYGSTRIVDLLDLTKFKKYPKWIIGFSDITALHMLMLRAGVESIHAAMPSQFSDPAARPSVQSLYDVLFRSPHPIKAAPAKSNIEGEASGMVIGGNLSILMDAMGTSIEPETKDRILVIEEVDEFKYKLDRMMTQLKRTGKLDKLAGLVVGYMTAIKDSNTPFGESVEQIILRHVQDANYPVAFGMPIGHEHPNAAWRHGSRMKLVVTSEGSVLVPQ